MRRSKNNHFLKLDPPRTQANIKRVSIFQPHHRGNTTDETSKTEVLQTPSATEVNLAQGVVRGFEIWKLLNMKFLLEKKSLGFYSIF